MTHACRKYEMGDDPEAADPEAKIHSKSNSPENRIIATDPSTGEQAIGAPMV